MRISPLIVTVLLMQSACMVAGTPAAEQKDIVLYVAQNGNDAWSGRLPEPNPTQTDGPLATLLRARDLLRELRASQQPAGRSEVKVRGGTHFLDQPLLLSPDDSGTAAGPVIYSAYPNEEVTLSGGRPITNWKKAEGNLWVAELPDVKAGKWHFRQLFVGGRRQVRARTPNFDPENPTTGGWCFVQPPQQPDRIPGAFGDTLANIHTPGDTFAWDIDVPDDGRYALWFYYGAKNEPHGRTEMDGRTTIRVDDQTPVPLVNLPDTGDWGTFRWSKTATLELARGKHRLHWTNVQGGGLNFDAFALSNDPQWQPAGTKATAPAAGKHRIVVQAEDFTVSRAKEFTVARKRRPDAKDRFRFRPGDFADWSRSPEPEIHIFPAWGWVNAILSVDRIDHQEHLVHVKNRNCSQELRPGNRYFVENVFEALDSRGEWHLDTSAGRLYYWPEDEDFIRQGVVAPALDRIVDLTGEVSDDGVLRPVEHVVIRGFTFRHTKYSLEVASVYTPDDGTVRLERARRCLIEGCKFLGVGGYAVRLGEHASDNYVIDNTVEEAGQGGALLVASETADQPTKNVIAGNRIHNCGKIWKHVAGVYVTTGSGNRIAHNTITDVPRYGISLKTFAPGRASHDNVIEYNRLERTNLETNDTGAIETLGRDREDSGNVIRYNLMLDAVGLKTTETGEMLTPHYTWGVYLDDYSSGTLVVGNVIARTVRGAIHVHLGRNNVLENNVLIDGADQQFECNGRQFMANNRFVRNIVSCRSGNLIRVNVWHDDVLAECDRNLYWQPGTDLAAADAPLTPKGSLAEWQRCGYDTNSLVADPLFIDAADDDYRLRPDSPALKLGFQPIEVEKIGVEGYVRPEGLP